MPSLTLQKGILKLGGMADVFTKKKRSQVMAAIRSRGNKDTEIKLASIMRAYKITGWRRHQPLPGRPDFIFRKERVAVFVDGCFWHGCPIHGRNPGTNASYWIPKLQRNRQRAREIGKHLTKRGWFVLRFWEHELADKDRVLSRLNLAFSSADLRQRQKSVQMPV